MRPGPHKRSRGRSHNPNHSGPSNPGGGGGGGGGGQNGRKHLPLRLQTFDSNGPSIKIRGNAYQVFEKYITLAREATLSGDRIAAEGFYQHAEHYFRIINADGGPQPQSMQRGGGEGEYEGGQSDGNGDGRGGQGGDGNDQGEAVAVSTEQPQPEQASAD
ncbi:uncharacterized protein DUF4167 [Stella humosa]|uniref:Uncharacterized protein DUF4167 n=1 Tax=Stella humosa TaxID=94 RepID=A0A3N1LXX6_9PROT|nr:DUF4167 domain-containing protein [Stella humosa]ROQ00054.1 uncharacterized protein DUF4167 [Stella humosa]BBK30713.1 hypothetical protein STHU_13470 [Stella humosa]